MKNPGGGKKEGEKRHDSYSDHDVTFREGYTLTRLYNVPSILRTEEYPNLLKILVPRGEIY